MEFNMKEVLQREMEKYTTNVVKEAVKALSIEYGFKAEEALEKMNLNEVRVGMKEKVEKVKKIKKIGGEGALPPPRIPLPFTGEIKEEWCKAMKQNHGLYSQCTSTAIPEGELCKTCQNQADKKGKPTCGYIRERQVGNLMEYKDEKGKKVQHYGVVLKKLKIAQADAEAEATKYGMVIPAEQYDIPEKSRGRPKKDQEGGDEADKKRGRPKKEKKVVSGSAADDIVAKLISEANKTKSANAADALLANLVAAAQAVQATPAPAPAPAEAVEVTAEAVEETAAQKCDCGDSECDDSDCDDSECEDEEKLAEQAEQKKLAQVAEQEKLAQEKIAVESKKEQKELEKAEKKAQQEAEKKEKKAQQEAEKKEKAEQAKVAKKAQQEQEKAEKKAQQEQEKAAKKAQQEQEKAEKKALQEQEKAAKKALNGGKGAAPPQEQEKAAKKALNGGKAAAPPKKAPEPTPEPTPELEHEEEESSHGAPPEEEANISVKKFEFEGRVYLRSGDDVLYDIKTQEPVGMWNAEENCIDEIEEDEE